MKQIAWKKKNEQQIKKIIYNAVVYTVKYYSNAIRYFQIYK